MKIGFSTLAPAAAMMGVALMAPAARAQDFSMDDACPGSTAITTNTFSFSSNSSGGGCMAFNNQTTGHITSAKVITFAVPGSPDVSDYTCDPNSGFRLFDTCVVALDPVTHILSFTLSNPDSTTTGGQGVAVGSDFEIDLRTFPCLVVTTDRCPNNAGGGWGANADFAVGLDGATPPALTPEPRMGIVAALAFGALVWWHRRNGAIRFSR